MKKKEIRSGVKRIYSELWTLLSLYEVTDYFDETPVGGKMSGEEMLEEAKLPGAETDGDILDHVERKIADIRKMVNVLLLGERKVAKSLMQIIDETEYFATQCEIPGVVTRWKKINPRLIYFDCAFDIMEKRPEEYETMRRGLTGIRLSCYPDDKMLAERNAYFEQIQNKYKRENRNYSEEKIFQDELHNTLTLLFEEAFREYL